MPDNKDYKKDCIQKISVEKKLYPGDHFILSSVNEGWFVEEGSLKLFFTDSSGQKETSKRFFLCDMEQGEYFYGIGKTTGQAQFIVTTSVSAVLLKFNNNLVFSFCSKIFTFNFSFFCLFAELVKLCNALTPSCFPNKVH